MMQHDATFAEARNGSFHHLDLTSHPDVSPQARPCINVHNAECEQSLCGTANRSQGPDTIRSVLV